MKKLLMMAVIISFGLGISSCGGEKKTGSLSTQAAENSPSSSDKSEASTDEKPNNRRGQLIFKQYCVICHGADGKLAISGAKDLSISVLSKEERINQVTNGKGLMTPYKDILSADQIEAVVEYLEELR